MAENTEPTPLREQASPSYIFKVRDVPFDPARDTQPHGIGPQGWIVGEYTDGSQSELLSYRQKPGGTTMIPAILLRGINQDGWMTGTYRSVLTGELLAFLHTGEQFLPLHVPDALESQGWDLNDAGWVVGTYRRRDFTGGNFRAFLYRRDIEEYADFEPPWPHGHASLHGVNNIGTMIGTVDAEGFGVDASGTFHHIAMPGAVATRPHGVNDQNVVVGSYEEEDGVTRGFILDQTVYTTLEVPFAGALHVDLQGINNHGVIVGSYWHEATATYHGFTATPQPIRPR